MWLTHGHEVIQQHCYDGHHHKEDDRAIEVVSKDPLYPVAFDIEESIEPAVIEPCYELVPTT